MPRIHNLSGAVYIDIATGSGLDGIPVANFLSTTKLPINCRYVNRTAKVLTVFRLGVLLVGRGGGGGSSGTSGNPSAFNTSEFAANFGLATIGTLTAYDNSGAGQGITVAVIDTGIDVDNSEFTGAIAAASTNTITNNTAYLQDDHGHRTAVAGVIAARKNGALTHEVAFDSTVLAIKADDVVGQRFSAPSLVTAINYAVENNAEVINLSLGGIVLTSAYQTALQGAVNAGVKVVAATGNEGGQAATETLVYNRSPNARLNLTVGICEL